jgi:hypothetical protein
MSVSLQPRAARARFVDRIAAEFEAAGVEYVVLHGGRAGEGVDSDVDVAVGRHSLETVDALIRLGTFGRLLQRFDYDVPWCRYYVVESDEPGRPYRQLDVACDPWGIGRYGASIRLALMSPEKSDDCRVASPGAETLYLALKRAKKGELRTGDAEQLRATFRRDPRVARDLLERHLGKPGGALADALERDRHDLTAEMRALRAHASLVRWKPAFVWRRLSFGALRVGRRVLRPTGLVVAVVGPDGVGKSMLAEGLERSSAGAFRRATRLHFGPGLLPPPARLLGRAAPDVSRPHLRSPSGLLGSLARTVYLWLDSRLGWWPKVSAANIRSTLVVFERGWDDLVIDPLRYRVRGTRLARALGRLLPAPDLVFFLDTEARVVHARKPELDIAEIARQLHCWRVLSLRNPARFQVLDAARPAQGVLDQAVAGITDRLASRQFDSASSELAWVSLGKPAQEGSDYWVISRRGRARWLLDAQTEAPGLLRTGIYRPAQMRHHVGAATLDGVRRASGGRLGATARLRVDPTAGLAPAIASHLGRTRVHIAGAAVPKDRGGRAVLTVCDGTGGVIAVAKVARDKQPLQHEQRVLEALAQIDPQTFLAPRVLASFEWRGAAVLVLEPVAISRRSDRGLAEPEIGALVELYELRDALAPVLGSAPATVPAHGDFAPWNSSRTSTGGLTLWDWEEAHLGTPLEDYFHWQVQRAVLLSRGTLADLVGRTLKPDLTLQALCDRLSIAPEQAPPLLRSYLEQGAGTLPQRSPGAERRVRALELLDRARA